eukprot:jgi/Chlat1/9112/Chrsp97S08421
MASWADKAEESEGDEPLPPPPPPGFEDVLAGTHKPDEEALAREVESLGVSEDKGAVDEPTMNLPSDKLNPDTETPETEIKKVYANDTPYTSAKSFEDLSLSEELLRGLYSEMNFERPSRIQADTLPMILNPPYANLIAQAHNGSGKTTCFVLGMLSRVDPKLRQPQALCICPTRELVLQNSAVLSKMGKYTGITCHITADDDSSRPSYSRSEKIADQIVIGTPGKLKNWITKTRTLPTKYIKVLVFDEADQMMDREGFADDSIRMMREIQKNSSQCQVLLFSATFNDKVKSFALRHVPNANNVFVPKEDLSLDVIKQYRVVCPTPQAKGDVLKNTILPLCENLGQTIIFVRTRENARLLHREMTAEGHKVTSIEGGMQFEDRDRVVNEFRAGTTKILISTDVLARGFDQAQVTLVINYDVPVDRNFQHPAYETYLHRIGRSGRFGRKGAAFNLVTGNKEVAILNQIEQYFQHAIPEVPFGDDDAFERVLKEAGLA